MPTTRDTVLAVLHSRLQPQSALHVDHPLYAAPCMTVRNGLTPADCTCSITANPTSKKGRIALLCMAGFAKA